MRAVPIHPTENGHKQSNAAASGSGRSTPSDSQFLVDVLTGRTRHGTGAAYTFGARMLTEAAKMTIEYFAERNPGTRMLPRSVATTAGGFVFVGGQVAREEDGGITAGGIEAQTRQTLKNVAHALALAGCTLGNIVKTTVWLEDPRDFDEFNRVYAEFFPEDKPSRSTLQGKNMVGTKIEIEAIAYRD
jgi:reactive intermediate/imine deaminase